MESQTSKDSLNYVLRPRVCDVIRYEFMQENYDPNFIISDLIDMYKLNESNKMKEKQNHDNLSAKTKTINETVEEKGSVLLLISFDMNHYSNPSQLNVNLNHSYLSSLVNATQSDKGILGVSTMKIEKNDNVVNVFSNESDTKYMNDYMEDDLGKKDMSPKTIEVRSLSNFIDLK